MIIVHPLDYPFYNAWFNSKVDEKKLFRLWNECGRKYLMGNKKNIEKWSLNNLIKQYTDKLKEISE